ncbi:MAG TPA: 3-methyl-2-oxobutanoate hydroxymethyltransferase, partial [Pirellulales bacterium]|nr:3-methyl-2-oxobutanoate hydroxymethyltransferase [Pirellulales bacterium]
EQAGAFAMVLECIPSEFAKRVTECVRIPTIGIGAGADCDGQVLVVNDLLGLTSGYVPKFVKAYADLRGVIEKAVIGFRDDVREGRFPGREQQFK